MKLDPILHDFWPGLPGQELQKWGGEDSWYFILYFMTSCKVLDYPDRNYRNEEVRTHETSPYTSWLPAWYWLPRQELQKWGGKDSWNLTLYFMTAWKVLDYPDRNCRNEEVRTHETSPYTSWLPALTGTVELLGKNSLNSPTPLPWRLTGTWTSQTEIAEVKI